MQQRVRAVCDEHCYFSELQLYLEGFLCEYIKTEELFRAPLVLEVKTQFILLDSQLEHFYSLDQHETIQKIKSTVRKDLLL